MNTTYPYLSRKKIIIGILLGGIILIVFIVSILPSQKSSKGEKGTPPSPTIIVSENGTKEISPSNAVPTLIIPEGMRWKTYKTEHFQFQYPPDWLMQHVAVTGGEAVFIRPNVLPEGINYPQFIMQTQPADIHTLQNTKGILEGFGLQKSDVSVDNKKAIQYTGTFPFKTVGTQTVQEPIQDTTVLLEDKNTTYIFKYEYEGNTPNISLNDYFNGFIKSFHLIK